MCTLFILDPEYLQIFGECRDSSSITTTSSGMPSTEFSLNQEKLRWTVNICTAARNGRNNVCVHGMHENAHRLDVKRLNRRRPGFEILNTNKPNATQKKKNKFNQKSTKPTKKCTNCWKIQYCWEFHHAENVFGYHEHSKYPIYFLWFYFYDDFSIALRHCNPKTMLENDS